MSLVAKEIIRPGTYWYSNQDTGLPQKLVVTPDSIKQGRAAIAVAQVNKGHSAQGAGFLHPAA